MGRESPGLSLHPTAVYVDAGGKVAKALELKTHRQQPTDYLLTYEFEDGSSVGRRRTGSRYPVSVRPAVGLFVVVLCHRATASTLRREAHAPVGDVSLINAPKH